MVAFATTFAYVHQVTGCTLHEGPSWRLQEPLTRDKHKSSETIEESSETTDWLARSDYGLEESYSRGAESNFP